MTSDGEGLTPSPFVVAAGASTALGLMPIPLERGGKRPVFDWKEVQERRLVDWDWDKADEYIRRWWGRPDPYNIAVLTGGEAFLDETRTSRLAVVDVDDQDARKLVERTCGWPLTPTVRTSHGWHLWFVADHVSGNRAKVAGARLDVRAAGGYVVVPPSIHPSGHVYCWDVGISWHEDDRIGMWPPAPMPDELHELLWPTARVRSSSAPSTVYTTKYVITALEREVADMVAATEGTRNDQLNRSAFALARFVATGQLEASRYIDELTQAALRTGLGEPEIRRTLASALGGRS